MFVIIFDGMYLFPMIISGGWYFVGLRSSRRLGKASWDLWQLTLNTDYQSLNDVPPSDFFCFAFCLFVCFFFFILSVSNELKSRFQIPGLSVKTNYKALPVRVSAVIVYATLYDFWSNHICDTLFQVLILVTSGVVMAVIMFLKAITFIVANISKVRHWFSCYWITTKTGWEVGQ